jgi:hypothetical protein
MTSLSSEIKPKSKLITEDQCGILVDRKMITVFRGSNILLKYESVLLNKNALLDHYVNNLGTKFFYVVYNTEGTCTYVMAKLYSCKNKNIDYFDYKITWCPVIRILSGEEKGKVLRFFKQMDKSFNKSEQDKLTTESQNEYADVDEEKEKEEKKKQDDERALELKKEKDDGWKLEEKLRKLEEMIQEIRETALKDRNRAYSLGMQHKVLT